MICEADPKKVCFFYALKRGADGGCGGHNAAGARAAVASFCPTIWECRNGNASGLQVCVIGVELGDNTLGRAAK